MRSAALVSVLVITAGLGCSLNPATNKPQLILTSQGQEQELGRKAAEEVEQTFGYVDDATIANYVSRVGQTVAAKAPEGQFQYQFRAVEMVEPNAFAIPGGFVYISVGLLALTNSEAELAGILGHEVGHVAARHGTSQASAQAPLRIITGIGAAATGIVSSSLGDFVSGVGSATTDALFAPYGRDQEREADELGQRFMGGAGYNPAALSTVLDSLHQYAVQNEQDDGPSFFSSHPATSERVETTRVRAQEISGSERASEKGRAAHLSKLNGLRLGEDPMHGVFLGTDFLQPAMGFTLRFPKGWKTANARDFVAARSDGALLVVTLAEGTDPMQAARAVEAQDKVDLKLRSQPIGGLAAARGEAVAEMEGRDAVLDVAWVAHGGVLYRVIGVSSVGNASDRTAVRRAIETFRPLTKSDRSRIRVERLRVVKTRGGETVASLAKRTGSRWSVRDLEVLNGVASGARLPAGEAVKIVREERY
ncbi:MAG: M48 family metalloprotease [Candidatus Binatia bacterium]|nr:M48 family metalloprotease [Candidatus Binatia bacterium]